MEDASPSAQPAPERELLLALAAAIQKYAMYPPGHPMLEGVAASLHGTATELVSMHGALSIGIARDRILVGDASVPTDAPMLKELSRRVLGHQIAAITIHAGVVVAEVDRLLAACAGEPGEEPLSLPAVIAIRLLALDYERIELGKETDLEQTASAGMLWDALARSALADDAADLDDVREVARAIAAKRQDGAFVSVVASHLVQVVDVLQGGESSADVARIRGRVSELIRRLDPDTLRALLRLDGDAQQRADVLRSAATAVEPDALVQLLSAAADESAASVSQGLLRVFAKLSAVSNHAPVEAVASARAELRHAMKRLLEDWTLENPNPEEYGRFLDSVSFTRVASDEQASVRPVGSERVLEISQEVGAWGPAAEQAAQTLLDHGEVEKLLELLRSGAGDADARSELAAAVLKPRLIYVMTSSDEVDRAALLEVSQLMGDTAVEPLLDALADSPSRNVRRCAFDCLSQLGETAARQALERASDERWFVTRNMLALAATAPLPESFDVLPFLENDDARVRAQAVAVARRAAEPVPALTQALADTDARVVKAALRALESVPSSLVTRLAEIAQTSTVEENRALAAKALGMCRHPDARDALITISGATRTLLGRTKVKHGTPEARAAIRALATSWGEDPAARPVLDAARRSRDKTVRAAAVAQ